MRGMLLAAGRGERLRPLTATVPKALVEVDGEPLIERHIRALVEHGITDLVINLGWLGDALKAALGDGARFGARIAYSDEGDDILETGGGIVRALPLLGSEPFIVINADIVTDACVPPMPQAGELGHLLLVAEPHGADTGDFSLLRDKVGNDMPRPYTFSGIAIYRPELFAGRVVERFPLAPLLRDAAAAGRLGGSVHRGYWFDAGTPERLAIADRFIAAQRGENG